MRKILFSRDSECIQPIRDLIEKQYHKTLVLWALDCAEIYLSYFEKNRPYENRTRIVLETARLWAKGIVKMPEAKKAIHAAHSAASEVGDKTKHSASVMAAGRAIGHAAATVHVETHALGVVFYGLTSQYYAAQEGQEEITVNEELDRMYQRLVYWDQNMKSYKGTWATFLDNETLPNKETLLRLKIQDKSAQD